MTDNVGTFGKDTMIVLVALGRTASIVNSINVYPNPARDIVTLKISAIKANSSDILIIISDIKGKIVYRGNRKIHQNTLTENVDISGFPYGIYTVRVYFDKKQKRTLKVEKL